MRGRGDGVAGQPPLPDSRWRRAEDGGTSRGRGSMSAIYRLPIWVWVARSRRSIECGLSPEKKA